MVSRRALLAGLAAPALPLPAAGSGTGAEASLALLRQPGHVALMRHATAPGTGDPEGFRLEACGTQRNLSEAGRAEAARIGAAFRAAGLGRMPVFSSQWCRCLETARLLGLGPVEPLPELNSFFAGRGEAAASTAALRRWIGGMAPRGPALLVTHQVNITALTGLFPAAGEVVLVDAGGRAGGGWRLGA